MQQVKKQWKLSNIYGEEFFFNNLKEFQKYIDEKNINAIDLLIDYRLEIVYVEVE